MAVNALSYLAVIAALVMLRPLRPGTRGRRAGGSWRCPPAAHRRDDDLADDRRA